MREGTALGAQGVELFWRVWDVEDPRCALLVVHGLGEHSGRYEALARFLVEARIAVFAFDLRGHGRSGGPRGDVDAFPRFLEDLVAMEDRLDGEVDPRLPRFLMGHSLGGLICLRRLQVFKGPYAGALFSAPWLATNLPRPILLAARALAFVFPTFSPPNGLGPGRLTRDPDIMRAWRADPLIHGRLTGRLFREVERVQGEVLASGGPSGIPLFFLLPGSDPVVKSDVTRNFAQGIVGKDVRFEILPDRLHEPFNDLGREEVYGMVRSWILHHVVGPPKEVTGAWDPNRSLNPKSP